MGSDIWCGKRLCCTINDKVSYMKKCIIILFVFIFFSFCTFMLFYEKNVRVLDVEINVEINVEMNENSNLEVTHSDIELLNICYDYTEKYVTGSLPGDKIVVESILDSINLISPDLFFGGFEKTSYSKRLEKDNSYFINGGILSENYLKCLYYKELVVLKLKSLLVLERYNDFKSEYISNYALFSTVGDNFISYILLDSTLNQSEDVVKAIADSYKEIFSMELSNQEKRLVSSDALNINRFGTIGEIYFEEFVDIYNQYKDKSGEIDIDNEQLNPFGLKLISNEEKINFYRIIKMQTDTIKGIRQGT